MKTQLNYEQFSGGTLLDTLTNDLGQKVELRECPVYGENAYIVAEFPEHKMCFSTGFVDCDDMTQGAIKNHISMDVIERNGWNPDEDMDYVPRLIEGRMFFKFEGDDADLKDLIIENQE